MKDKADQKAIDDVVALLDQFVEQGEGRLKFKTSEHIPEGEVRRGYQYGRCDMTGGFSMGSDACSALDEAVKKSHTEE